VRGTVITLGLSISLLGLACDSDADSERMPLPDEPPTGGKADQPDALVDCTGATHRKFDSVWRECRIYGERSALQPGEVVWTIDDGVSASTAAIAESLGVADAPATFFPIASSLVEACGGSRCTSASGRARMSHIIHPAYEHTVSNHTFSHPTGLAAMSPYETRVEVADAHFAIRNAIVDAGGDLARSFYPAFRSPGNSWARDRASLLNYDTLAGYRGPFAWDMPSHGEEDFRCWSAGKSVRDCALDGYLPALFENRKGIVLLHSSPKSAELTDFLINELRFISRTWAEDGDPSTPCIKFVPLACALPEDRDSYACGESRQCVHEL